MKTIKRMLALCLCLCLLTALAGCGKNEYVKNAESLISAIGEFTTESEKAVTAAEEAFAALTDEDKSKVDNAAQLTEAREELETAFAKEVEELISAIGEVSVDSEESIAAAEKAYDALSAERKARVGNAGQLTEARAALETALVEKAAAELEALRQALLGQWQTDADETELVIASVDKSVEDSGLSFRDYLDSFVVTYVLELKEDGTFRLFADPDALKSSLVGVKDATLRFYDDLMRKLLGELLAENGAEGDLSTWEAIEAALETSKDEIFQQSLGMSLSEFVDALFSDDAVGGLLQQNFREGSFTVEQGKLHLSQDSNSEPEDGVYEAFVLEGDVLTFTEFTGDNFYDGLEYPIEFRRAG